jgi:hypothetical protein
MNFAATKASLINGNPMQKIQILLKIAVILFVLNLQDLQSYPDIPSESSRDIEDIENIELEVLANDAHRLMQALSSLDKDYGQLIINYLRGNIESWQESDYPSQDQALEQSDSHSGFTLNQLDNLQYHAESGNFKLINGYYTSLLHIYGNNCDYWKMDREICRGTYIGTGIYGEGADHAFGDLNADGLEDAVVILRESSGGTGVDISLAMVMNENGIPRNTDTVELGDRKEIQSIIIDDGIIYVSGLTHRPEEGLMQPTLPAVWIFRVNGELLEQISGPKVWKLNL